MALRLIVDLVLSLVTMAFIESRGLKAVCSEDHLCTSSTDGLRFSCVEERLPQAMASMVLTDPEVHDLGAAAPGVATDTRDDFASFILNACPQEPSIEVAGRLRVELVDAFHEEFIQLLAPNFVEQHNSPGLHGA